LSKRSILLPRGAPTGVYYAEDTGIFGDMKISGELYKPARAFNPY